MPRQAAERIDDVVGDGMSGSTILAQAVFADGVRNVAAGASAIDLRRGLDRAIGRVRQTASIHLPTNGSGTSMRRTGVNFSSKCSVRLPHRRKGGPRGRSRKRRRYAVAPDLHGTIAVSSPELLLVQGDRRYGLRRDTNVALGGFSLRWRNSYVPWGYSGMPTWPVIWSMEMRKNTPSARRSFPAITVLE
jgi:hypothetical protein